VVRAFGPVRLYPEYPPLSDTLPAYELTTWTGFVVASATPRDLVQKIADDVLKATRNAEVRRKLADFGYETDPLGPLERLFATLWRRHIL
jgi:tripartite-type tricarboxylate transporter receptor subunit TctC